MKKTLFIFPLLIFGYLLSSCMTTNSEEFELIYPMYVDTDLNNINDYVESSTHEGAQHSFVDLNEDDICDLAQNGGSTWHGPGFVDNNSNGICDFWDQSMPMHAQHEGIQYHDANENNINDYMAELTHMADNHDFIDENQDNICDYAQDGSPIWHGPGFVDNNNNGMSDHWENGGRGHGSMMRSGRNG